MKNIVFIILLVLFYVTSISAQNFSSKQINEDIDYLKETIKENYPYLDVHKRKYGFNWESNIDTIKYDKKNTYDLKELTGLLTKYLKGLNGHVRFLDNKQYAYYLNGYSSMMKDYPEYKVWVNVLTSKKSVSTYKESDIEKQAPLGNRNRNSNRFNKELMGNMIYIRIPTFDGYYEKEEGRKIVEYLKVMSDPSKSIVFDIRGNGGGSDLFWLNSIVKPLINKNISYENYYLFLAGKDSMPYLTAKKITLRDTKDLPKELQRPENKNFKYFDKDVQEIEATGEKIQYKKIFVLMDKSNFSSSESFVHFCKVTGFAVLIGQRSSVDGIGFDPILIQLPNTGLILTLPIDAALNSNGTLNYEYGTEPDIVLNESVDSKSYVNKLISKQ
jgi:hypothetical protein